MGNQIAHLCLDLPMNIEGNIPLLWSFFENTKRIKENGDYAAMYMFIQVARLLFPFCIGRTLVGAWRARARGSPLVCRCSEEDHRSDLRQRQFMADNRGGWQQYSASNHVHMQPRRAKLDMSQSKRRSSAAELLCYDLCG